MGRLDARVALVTGGSRGIGEAIALDFARNGATVVICSRRPEGVAAAAERINAEVPGSTTGLACHVGQPDAIEAMFEQVCTDIGVPRVLVNNAGTNPYFGPLLGAEWGAWDKTFEVNLKGPFACTRAFAQRRLASGDPAGSVICVSSILGRRAAPMQGIYAMTKSALISLVQTLAVELADAGIRVNAIAPGFVDTRLSSAISTDPALREMVLQHTPMKRVATPSEGAGCATYLASDESSFTTGQTFFVDGGYTVL